MIRENGQFRAASGSFRPSIGRHVAVEIASMIVYRGGFERNFEDDLRTYVARDVRLTRVMCESFFAD